jgi:hypothetical protein
MVQPSSFWRHFVVEQSHEVTISPDPQEDRSEDASRKIARDAAPERVERCMQGLKRGMYEALALEFRRKEPQAIDEQDPGLGIITSQWIYNHVDQIAELGRPRVEQHVEKTRALAVEKVVKDAVESGKAWIHSCRRQVQAFVCSYVETLVASLDKLGLREIMSTEEMQYLRVTKILRPDLSRMHAVKFVKFSGHELGIQQSNQDFEEKLMFCRAYAFRKGIRDAAKDLGDELSTDERRFLEKKIFLTWEDVRRDMGSISVTAAYSVGKARAEQVVLLALEEKHTRAIKI